MRKSDAEKATNAPRRNNKQEEALRWHAIQLAGQLPENREDALRVIELTHNLVNSWLLPESEAATPSRVLRLAKS